MSELSHDRIRRWRENPVSFVRENFGVEPDEWQCDALHAFNKYQRICFKASKGVGKTAVLSWMAWLFLATRPHPKIAATSINADNLADGLWSEMATWQNKSVYLKHAFVWTKTRIFAREHPETWWMSARSWAKGADANQQANALAGLHADYVLFLLDESGGIPDAVMAAAEAALSTGIELKLVQAGNPTHLEGPLYRACTSERHLWHVITINSDPDNPKRSPRVSAQWAKEQIEKYGRSNPWVMVNVFGEFPPGSINTLLGVEEIEKAMQKGVREEDYSHAQKRLGIDVARFGDDRTVIFPRQGLRAYKPVEIRNARTNDIAARVMQAKSKWNSELEFVDGTGGYGSGVIDSLIQAGASPYEIHFSGKAIDNRYFNKRAEMWFLMAEWIRRGGSLPNMPDLGRELATPTYTFNNGKFQVEPKDQIKERLGFSPDIADALCLTFALPEMQSSVAFGQQIQRPRVNVDYDPFGEERMK